jgi:hypothetical protein
MKTRAITIGVALVLIALFVQITNSSAMTDSTTILCGIVGLSGIGLVVYKLINGDTEGVRL